MYSGGGGINVGEIWATVLFWRGDVRKPERNFPNVYVGHKREPFNPDFKPTPSDEAKFNRLFAWYGRDEITKE